MEITKKLQKLSLAALIVSLLPLATLVPVFLKVTLPDGVRTVWAFCNIILVLAGLLLSVIYVKSKESRSIVNILSTVISVFLALMISCPCVVFPLTTVYSIPEVVVVKNSFPYNPFLTGCFVILDKAPFFVEYEQE